MKASDTLELISKQWASVKDIQLLADCGRDTALKIKNAIVKELENWILPKGQIPMSKLVEYLKIDINYLKRVERS